ncbi:hypothetical protein [Roseateles noduli]|uniref:hypothetical protein n=1 Tax=Roseateles noduli TaxID=2052484 RepID=UPI003D64A823
MTSLSDAVLPAPLGARMAPLLRELEKGGTMSALVGIAGKETAVLVSRQAIAKPGRDLLTDHLKGAGTPRFQAGECHFEDGAYTFVLADPAEDLGKRLSAALLKQLGKRVKVQVRGIAGSNDDQAGSATPQPAPRDEPSSSPSPSPSPSSPAPVQSPQSPQTAQTAQTKTATASTAPGHAFNARLATLLPEVKSAMSTTSTLGEQLKLKISEAGVHARNKRFDEANALPDRVDQLLASARANADGVAAGAPESARERLDEAGFLEHWPQARQTCLSAVAAVDRQVAQLISVLKASQDQELRDIAEFGLPAVTGNFKVPLSAAIVELDMARGTRLPSAARKVADAARAFADYLDREETVRVTDENEFGVTVSIRATLGEALRAIETLTGRVI